MLRVILLIRTHIHHPELTLHWTIGPHMKAISHSKLLNFFSRRIRRLQNKSTLCSTCGQHHWLSITTLHHSQVIMTCTTLLMRHHLVIFHGRHSPCPTMVPNHCTTYHHGWMRPMMFGSGTLTSFCMICLGTPISTGKWNMSHIRTTLQRISTASRILFQVTGHGAKQYILKCQAIPDVELTWPWYLHRILLLKMKQIMDQLLCR